MEGARSMHHKGNATIMYRGKLTMSYILVSFSLVKSTGKEGPCSVMEVWEGKTWQILHNRELFASSLQGGTFFSHSEMSSRKTNEHQGTTITLDFLILCKNKV